MKIVETNLKCKANKRSITNKIIIHHSASINGSAKLFHEWHSEKGYGGIGYHYVILKNGTIERGRSEDLIGAHCIGQNYCSIGICLVGNFTKEKPTNEQVSSCIELCSYLCNKYSIKAPKNIYGHNYFYNTQCPGFLVNDLIANWVTIIDNITKHTIKKGDTIESVAKTYNTTANNIAILNGLIEVGKTIRVK